MSLKFEKFKELRQVTYVNSIDFIFLDFRLIFDEKSDGVVQIPILSIP